MKSKAILSLACLVMLSMTAVAQKKYEIKLNVKPGQKVEQTTVSTSPLEMTASGQDISMKMTVLQNALVEAVSKEGPNTKLKIRNKKLDISVSMPAFGVDQTISSEDKTQSKESALARALVSAPVTIVVDPNGKMVGAMDSKELMQNIEKALPKEVSIESFRKLSLNLAKLPFGGIDLPGKPIAIGESWQSNLSFTFDVANAGEVKTENKMTLTLKEVTAKHYVITGVSDFTSGAQGVELKGVMNGTFLLDRNTGLLSQFDATMDLKGDGETQGQAYSASAKGTVKTTTK